MPRREDIERFKEVLNSLGSEPAIRAGRSETIEEVVPPDEGLPSDINELLGSFAGQADEVSSDEEQALSSLEEQAFGDEEAVGAPGAGTAGDAGSEPGAGPGEADFDLGGMDDLEGLGAEEPAGRAVPAASAPAATGKAGSDVEGIDFDSLFGEQGEAPAIDDLERKSRPGRRQKRERPGKRTAESAPEAPAFGEDLPGGVPPELPTTGEPATEEPSPVEPSVEQAGASPGQPADELPLDLQADLGSMEILPEEPVAEAAEMPVFDEAAKAEEEPAEPALSPGTPALAAPASEELSSLEPLDMGEGFGLEEFPAEAEGGTGGAGAETAEPADEEQLVGLDMAEFDIPEGPAAAPAARKKVGAARAGVKGAGAAARPGAPARGAGGMAAVAGRAAKARDALRGAAARAAKKAAPVAARIAPRMGPAARAQEPEELEAAAGPVDLTPAQFERLKKTLDSLPRNLRIVVEEIVAAGSGTPGQLAALLRLLVEGASAQDIAALCGRVTGKKIRVPAGYEKKTGLAFEEERRTFGYAFRENIFPVLRLFVLSAVAVGLLAFLGYRFIYRPVTALSNYSRGLTHIEAERYTLANERFARAVGLWPRRTWYYRYADAFAAKRQFLLAEQKYDDLLRRYPGDRKGILDYARMESRSMSNYEKADALLLQILDTELYDYDALLAAGDNHLSWADSETSHFEDARRSYAALIGKYGQKDELLFRMLRYFIRTDKVVEVERLKAYYAARPKVKVDPEAYAEMGGYLADKGQEGDRRYLDDVPEVLFRALKVRPDLPVIHYNLGRYYRMVGDAGEERKALRQGVLPLLRPDDPLTKQRMTIEIDTHTRLGDLDYRQKAYLDAGKRFTEAIALVEKYQGAGLLRRERIFGAPYAGRGDLEYYVEGRLAEARADYRAAVANGWTEPLLDYKLGYIDYAEGSWDAAIAGFLKAEDGLAARGPSMNLLYALATAFGQKGDYFAAQGTYLRLRDRLSTRQSAVGVLKPEQEPEHKALMELMVKTDNNLGVVMVRLAERTGDRKKRSQALVSFTSAAETADVLSRRPDTLVRSEAKNLPFLNMRGVLYPVSGFELQLYRAIPKDFETLFF